MSEDVHMNSYTYINLYICQPLTVVVVHGADKKPELCLILLDYLDMQNKKEKEKVPRGLSQSCFYSTLHSLTITTGMLLANKWSKVSNFSTWIFKLLINFIIVIIMNQYRIHKNYCQ